MIVNDSIFQGLIGIWFVEHDFLGNKIHFEPIKLEEINQKLCRSQMYIMMLHGMMFLSFYICNIKIVLKNVFIFIFHR